MLLQSSRVAATALVSSMTNAHLASSLHAVANVPWVDLAGTMAPLASLLVFAAPFPTIRQISREKNTGSLPLLPYTCTVASAVVWTTYGILRKQPTIWSSNGIGLFLGLYYFLQFAKFGPKKSPALPGSIRQHVEGCVAISGGTVLGALAFPSAAPAVGILGVIMCIAMFASPLAALKTVLETKSAKSIPLPFTLAAVANCFLWSVVGVFDMKDFNIIFPNLLGLASGLTQLALKILYRNGSAEVEMAM